VSLEILVVDDDEGLREMIAEALRLDGNKVTEAEDGQKGLEASRAKKFDVLITDVNMPGMDGLELFQTLRGESPNVDVIVMTGNAELKDAVKALHDGAADYLAKPFDLTELRVRTRRLGERQRLARELNATRQALKERLGSYVLEEQIGEGAMGIVYRASHVMLRRPTAIKFLLRAKNPIAVARFEREVRLTCRLTHPNTIAIYDYGRTDDNVFFYAMELLNGASLAEVVTSTGKLEAGRAVRLLTQLCGSLTEAHALGLIHRDVKPSNIHLCERGRVYDTAKLLDFGLVKEVENSAPDVTQEHVILGTPAYLAPEVIRNAAASSTSQDLYALGCAAYYMLAGLAPFFAPLPMDVYLQHLQEPPRPFSKRGVKVPRKLEALIFACLEKKPENRPHSADDVRRELLDLRIKPWTDDDAFRWWQVNDMVASKRDPSSGRTANN